MENLNELVEPNIDYNIYNALNLINEDLGELHKTTGFNPFNERFELSLNYVADALENNKMTPEIQTPEFVLNGEKETKNAFVNTAENCEELIVELSEKLNDNAFGKEEKEAISKTISELKMRVELAKFYSDKLKTDKNDLKMYKNLLSINWKTAVMLENTFKKEYFKKQVLEQLLMHSSQLALKISKQNSVLKAKAQEIIANNLKQQELSEVQSPKVEEVQQKPIEKPVKQQQEVVHKETPTNITETNLDR